MKKVINGTKKLTLGKMTVAKLEMNEQQMYLINGGNVTKPATNNGTQISFVNEPNNPCTLVLPTSNN